MTGSLFVCSNNLVNAPLISLPWFDFRGKRQPYLYSTSIIDKMNLWYELKNELMYLLDLTATTHLLHKQSQDVFEKFDMQAYVK